jgi:hypothetical protein
MMNAIHQQRLLQMPLSAMSPQRGLYGKYLAALTQGVAHTDKSVDWLTALSDSTSRKHSGRIRISPRFRAISIYGLIPIRRKRLRANRHQRPIFVTVSGMPSPHAIEAMARLLYELSCAKQLPETISGNARYESEGALS